MNTDLEQGNSPSLRPTQTLAADYMVQAHELDSQIAWHYAQIVVLKARRNAIVPIHRLPNELMTRIFTIFATESDSDMLFNLEWTQIMRVCHHWHAVALAAQHLWAYIEVEGTGSRFFPQLRRSGAAPLTIKLNLSEYTEHYVQYIMGHSVRIRELNFKGEAKYVFEFIASLPEFALGILSTLILKATMGTEDVPSNVSRSLPRILFDGKLPRLQALSLDSIECPWPSLTGLTALSLTGSSDSSQSTPSTFAGLLDMLRACPQLISLKLAHLCPPLIPGHLYASVDLLALKSLRLRDPATSCQALLEHLRIPSEACISLLAYGLRSGNDIRGILVPIRKHLRSARALKPLLLKIDRYGNAPEDGHCMTTFADSIAPPDLLFVDKVNYPLLLNCHPTSESALREMLTKLLKAVPCQSVTHLDGRAAYEMRTATWRTVIMYLSSLETVYLFRSAGAANCIDALREIETKDPERRMFPRIRRLHIRVFRLQHESDTLTNLLIALEKYLKVLHKQQQSSGASASLQTLEFEHDHVLSHPTHDGRLQRMFGLMQGDIIVNGRKYDPIERAKQIEEIRAKRKALAIEMGLEKE
ncbi:F-box domain-containing protein [Favolaschia claudopus]|uniref:F-box domain-containing protein n=1 Tax=Favolaschia claudopus TaxID=2862362 RepID=A0AAW0AZH4_9AGAR